MGNKSKSPRQCVVSHICTRIHSLVEKAQIARRDGERLVSLVANHLAVAYALCPCRAGKNHVIRSRERVRFGCSKVSPGAIETARSPGAEVAVAVSANGLDDKHISSIPHVVYARSFKQAVSVIQVRGFGDDWFAHSRWEAGDWSRGTIEVPVVIRKEEVAVCGIADRPHVDPVSAPNILDYYAGLGGEEVCWSRPASRVVDILVRGVGGIAILENQVPETLRFEEEHFGSRPVAGANSTLIKVVEWSGVCLVEIGEVQVDKAVTGFLRCAREDMICAVYFNDRRIFDACDTTRVILRED